MEFERKLHRAEAAVAHSLQSGLPHLLRAGTGPVLFSAPHSVEQTRQGRAKAAEPQTAEQRIDGTTLRTWNNRDGYTISLAFDAKDMCLGVESEG